ncbi:GYDIA family GHMP kinase [Wenyingzhuangia sp. IMCC45533]
MSTYYSNGKLLISAEYLVLDGAVSLALPTKYGQALKVECNESNQILWSSYNVLKECWFSAVFNLNSFEVISSSSEKVSKTLQEILRTAKKLNPNFLNDSKGVGAKTSLTFPNEWGLGTSSTLIHSIASWAEVNPFELLELSFGGSGYDIACAKYNTPITFQRNGITPNIQEVNFNPSFKNQLFFVYLNNKQDSKEGIKLYRSLQVDKSVYIHKINALTQQIIEAKNLAEFDELLNKHEGLLSSLIGVTAVKEKLFADYTGSVKSLGAWGGDFVLVTGTEVMVKSYFTSKNYKTILSYEEMIKS